MRAYSLDLRKRVLADCDRGDATLVVAKRYQVSAAWVRRLRQRRRESGEIEPRKSGQPRGRRLAAYGEQLKALNAKRPDATLAELREALGASISIWTIWRALRDLKLSLKKTIHAAEQGRPDVAARRAEWRIWQIGLDPRSLVFLDETWATTNLIHRYGWGPRDKRLIDKAPHGHRKTTTFLAALRHDGLHAPLVADGPINGELFVAYVRQQLVPTLRPGDLVIMDNLSAHKVRGVREAIAAAHAQVVYLPPYSPDLNPIEMVFSKLRRLLQTAAERTIAQLWTRIGACVELFKPQECANYFRHTGYRYK